MQRQQARPNRAERMQTRVANRQQQPRANRVQQARDHAMQRRQVENRAGQQRQQAQNRAAQRQQAQQRVVKNQHALDRMHERMQARQQARSNRINDRVNQAQNRLNDRRELRADRLDQAQTRLIMRNNERFARLDRQRAFAPVPARLSTNVRVIPVGEATRFIGAPISTLGSVVTLAALPASVGYLYPTTPNYYYQYGGGYLYQVDRSTSLIDALIPLLAGGYLPGTYLPQAYMSSYVPNYYGLNSFYPASYGNGYGGYGYDNLCNRYAYGVVYQVDCYTGMVENVIPTYAGGYGVGQMIPSSYSYYNVPMQYRDMYYPTDDYSYWYAPGAIYQYDRDSSLITSVAALMSPGFSIGQPIPAGYGVYNVPYAYRATYYDTPNAWYRYNNGYIYQVDPTTQLVTAIVASLLT